MPSPDCEIRFSEDITHQRSEWRLERAAWCLIGLLLVAGLAGLFGAGPLSRQVLAAGDAGMEVEYQRFERRRARTGIKVVVQAGRTGGVPVRLAVGGEFLDANEVTRIEPEPEGVTSWPDRNVYVFDLPDAEAPATIRLYFEPAVTGGLTTRLQLDDRAPVEFRQFIYP